MRELCAAADHVQMRSTPGGGRRSFCLVNSRWPPAATAAALQEQALKQAADLQHQASLSAKEGLQGARLVAADLARGEAQAAGRTLGGLLRAAAAAPATLWLARLLVCLFFVNSVWDSLATWSFMRQPEVLERAQRWPQHYPPVRCAWVGPGARSCLQASAARSPPALGGAAPHPPVPCSFPLFGVAALLPCAVLAALGVRVRLASSLLVAYQALDSARLVWTSLALLLGSGMQPSELVVKRLAVLGCTALVLAQSIHEQRGPASSYAGLLLAGGGGRRQPGRGKSLLLLAGRLLVALLFVYVGVQQVSGGPGGGGCLWRAAPAALGA